MGGADVRVGRSLVSDQKCPRSRKSDSDGGYVCSRDRRSSMRECELL